MGKMVLKVLECQHSCKFGVSRTQEKKNLSAKLNEIKKSHRREDHSSIFMLYNESLHTCSPGKEKYIQGMHDSETCAS